MIDIYAMIAVGIALGLGLIPLIKAIKTKDKNLLVAHVFNKTEFKEYLEQLKKDGDWIE
jgi:hypothetical protein